MDLLERYLQAIGQYLPADTRADVLAELRANLLEQMDARREEFGRHLTEADVADVLRQHGKPEVVALRYLPQRSLIGPTVFPFYTFTLVRMLPLVVFATAVARGIVFVTTPRESIPQALLGLAGGLVTSLLISAALITAVFAMIEWAIADGLLGTKWNEWEPAKLPHLKSREAAGEGLKPTVRRALELTVHCLWMAYVLWVPWHPFWLLGPGIFFLDSLRVSLAPIWHPFYALLVTTMVVQLVMRLLAFAPSARRAQAPMKVATDLLSLVGIGLLASASTFFVASGPAADLQKIADVNHAVGLAFRIVFVLILFGFVKELWTNAQRPKPMRVMAF